MRHETYKTLADKSLFEAQLSDHKPLIKDGFLSWNIMMRGRESRNGFNTAFALIEDQRQYQQRLQKIVAVLAEVVRDHPEIKVIGFQEAPIVEADIDVFFNEMEKYPELSKFVDQINREESVTAWGLMTLVDRDLFDAKYLPSVWCEELNAFNDRAQVFSLIDKMTGREFSVLNTHMPYREAHNQPEYVADKLERINQMCLAYKLEQGELVVLGDLNTDPSELAYNAHYQQQNNIQLTEAGIVEETVDAIMVSAKVSQVGLFKTASLVKEAADQSPCLNAS